MFVLYPTRIKSISITLTYHLFFLTRAIAIGSKRSILYATGTRLAMQRLNGSGERTARKVIITDQSAAKIFVICLHRFLT